MICVAEKDSDSNLLLQLFVPSKEQIIVGCSRFPFRIPLFDLLCRMVDGRNADLVNGLKERHPELSVRHDKQDASPAFTRHNEIEFGMADSHSVIDGAGSFVDEGSTVQGPFGHPLFSSPSSFFEFRFDLPAIHAS